MSESSQFLAKAQSLLAQADTMLGVGLNDAAGRTAYLVGFHVAQPFIFERLHKVLKTHNGVQTEFLRLTKDDFRIDKELRGFLSKAYNLKAVADYETGPGAVVSAEQARNAVKTSKRFVACVSALVSDVKPLPSDSREKP